MGMTPSGVSVSSYAPVKGENITSNSCGSIRSTSLENNTAEGAAATKKIIVSIAADLDRRSPVRQNATIANESAAQDVISNARVPAVATGHRVSNGNGQMSVFAGNVMMKKSTARSRTGRRGRSCERRIIGASTIAPIAVTRNSARAPYS